MTFFAHKRRWWAGLGLIALMALGPAWAWGQGGRMLGGRADFVWTDLPSGRLRDKLARLPAPARQRAEEHLKTFTFAPEDMPSLDADERGDIFYACVFPPVPGQAAEPSAPAAAEAAAVPVAPFPAGLKFHSRPGAPNVIYLDFDGHAVSGTAWNNSLNRDPIPAVPFDVDGNTNTFSDAEQAAIKRIWQRVAEDYAPFDVDVTTEEPAVFNNRTARALLTRNTDANGLANPSSSAGGVAYVNVFGGSSLAYYSPAWVYINNLALREDYIAEAASHEVGHNMGLSHDGQSGGTEYYGGHGSGETSWAPIMGVGYGRNVTQWSKGEYYLANNTQDDLAIVAGKLTYRADDAGDAPATAGYLEVASNGAIRATTPETDPADTQPANKGIVGSSSDVDWRAFNASSGPVCFFVQPWISPADTRGGNLDVALRLLDDQGNTLATHDPAAQTAASIVTNLPAGRYYLEIRGVGVGTPTSSSPSGYTAYGVLGQYFVTGYVAKSAALGPPQAALLPGDVLLPALTQHTFQVTYSDDFGIDVSTIDGNDIRVTGPAGYDRAAAFVSLDAAGDGTPRTAIYAVAPPGAEWTIADNGAYQVWLQSNQVANLDGLVVPAGPLGSFTCNVPVVIYEARMDVNPGWTLQTGWAYGKPAGLSGDPSAGCSGSNVVGYNLSGNYAKNISLRYATTPVIDCSAFDTVQLRYQRKLGLRSGDGAVVGVTADGAQWTTIWSSTADITDAVWTAVLIDVSAIASNRSAVQFRWGISANSDNRVSYGWNLDDVLVFGKPTPPRWTLHVEAASNQWGSVTPATGTFVNGSVLTLMATPSNYYRFNAWSGDLSGTNNPFTLTLTTNVTAVALFGEILTTNHPTPLWWLAQNGYGVDYEFAVAQVGLNGYPVWQSYIAGLVPADPASILEANTVRENGGYIVTWRTVAGRVYTVLATADLQEAFQPLPDAIQMPPERQAYTSAVPAFFRILVEKP